jgi:hypothetical protein
LLSIRKSVIILFESLESTKRRLKVAEKMVILNGMRVPLSAVRPVPTEIGDTPELPVETPEILQSKPIETIKARLDALLEDSDFDKLGLELPAFEEILDSAKTRKSLLTLFELIGVGVDETMTMAQMRDVVLLPYKVTEPDL